VATTFSGATLKCVNHQIRRRTTKRGTAREIEGDKEREKQVQSADIAVVVVCVNNFTLPPGLRPLAKKLN